MYDSWSGYRKVTDWPTKDDLRVMMDFSSFQLKKFFTYKQKKKIPPYVPVEVIAIRLESDDQSSPLIKASYAGDVGAQSEYSIEFLNKRDAVGQYRLKYIQFCTECHIIHALDKSKNLLGRIPSGFYMGGHNCTGPQMIERVINCERGETILGFGIFEEPYMAMDGWK